MLLSSKKEKQEDFRNLDRQAAEVINVMTNSRLSYPEGKEKIDMCQAIREMMEDSRAEGRRAGKKEGKREGELRVNHLIQYLVKQGRTEEIVQMVTDETYQEKLFAEFGL